MSFRIGATRKVPLMAGVEPRPWTTREILGPPRRSCQSLTTVSEMAWEL